MKVVIRQYHPSSDEDNLIKLMLDEGDEWSCYTSSEYVEMYKIALRDSLTYVAYVDSTLVGFSRSIHDHGFYIYVCDLLVSKQFRGNHIGKQLMECIYKDFANVIVYVMSDVDPYYQKLGYIKEGTVFEVMKSSMK